MEDTTTTRPAPEAEALQVPPSPITSSIAKTPDMPSPHRPRKNSIEQFTAHATGDILQALFPDGAPQPDDLKRGDLWRQKALDGIQKQNQKDMLKLKLEKQVILPASKPLEDLEAPKPLLPVLQPRLPALSKPVHILPDIISRSPSPAVTSEKETWDISLGKVISGTVSIKATTLRPFDSETAGNYCATGFVIDAQKGLILSNRHVVSPAPITAVAVFVNYEEVPIYPVYRDPVHDFGIFRYEPEKLKHMKVTEIPLCPELARVGMDIKVVGNDAGEKLSILGSTLARLDRQAPSYGIGNYNDFNTFYYQAASGTSGGSSGSAVVNIFGQAVALNAGGSNSSQSSFYLPLNRVVRAVEKIKKGEPVLRGTLQTEFVHTSYDELKKIGLSEDEERACRIRDPTATGLLTVSRVLKGGPACPARGGSGPVSEDGADGVERVNALEPTDILLSCNGEYITNFIALWTIIDESIDENVTLRIYRGKKLLECVLRVQDLHSISPRRFLEMGGGIFHDLSYQMARSYNEKIGSGAFCAASGFLMWSHWTKGFLIEKVDGKPTPTLDAFIEAVSSIKDYQRVQIMTRGLGKTDCQTMMIDMDRHFFLAAVYERDDEKGTWNRTELGNVSVAEESPAQNADSAAAEEAKPKEEDEDAEVDEEDNMEAAIDDLRSALCYVVCRLPYSVEGQISNAKYSGVGLVIQLDPMPLVLFDRTSVPSTMVDLRLTISHRNIPGRVVYMGTFALVTFDKALLPSSSKVRVPEWDDAPLKVREEIKIFGLNADGLLSIKETSVSSIGVNFNTWACNPPRFRIINIENVSIAESASCWGGVLTRKSQFNKMEKDSKIKVSAYLMTVASQNRSGDDTFWTQGLDLKRYVFPIVEKINEGKFDYEESLRCLGFEFADMSLATVSTMGLSDARFAAYVKAAKKYRGVPRPIVTESRLQPPKEGKSADDESGLQISDIVLEIDGTFMTRVSQLADMDFSGKTSVTAIVLRGGKEITLEIPTVKPMPMKSDLVVQFYGCICHATQAPQLEQVAKDATLVPRRDGCYVGGVSYGSSALDFVRPTQWIIEVDGVAINSLQNLLDLVEEQRWQQGQYIRIKQVNRKGITSVVSVKVDDKFWPVLSFTLDPKTGRWAQKRHSGV